MAHFYQFVDAISATPNVLLDLDNRNPFTVVEGTSTSPPTLERSTMKSQADGSVETGTSYNNREIVLELGMELVAAETQATAIQTLARILDRRQGAWLKWQSEGMTKPLFFRTKRANFQVIDNVLDAKPDRALTIPLEAEPFGYGLAVSSNAVITNSPVAGTNKMAFKFPAIQGDVATPLRLSFTDPIDAVHRIVFGSCSFLDGTVGPGTPYWRALNADTIGANELGVWTLADAADTAFISDVKRTMTRVANSGGDDKRSPHSAQMVTWTALPPGDYRGFIRGRGTAHVDFQNASGKKAIANEIIGTTAVVTWDSLSDVPIAMPGGVPPSDLKFGLNNAIANPPFRLDVFWDELDDEDNGGTIDLDGLLMIPVDLPNAVCRFGFVSFPTGYTSKTVVVDGINGDRRYATATKDAVTQFVAPDDLGGGTPVVVPGADNTLFFLATVNPGLATAAADSETSTITVNYTYHPRYLSGDRPNLT